MDRRMKPRGRPDGSGAARTSGDPRMQARAGENRREQERKRQRAFQRRRGRAAGDHAIKGTAVATRRTAKRDSKRKRKTHMWVEKDTQQALARGERVDAAATDELR